MSDFAPALAITLQHEGGYADDDTRRASLPTAAQRAVYIPTGEVVNRGLTHWFLRGVGFLPPQPRSVPCSDSEKSIVRGMTLAATTGLYAEYFWTAYRAGQITDQTVAAKYFDICVNTGGKEACLILQRAINSAMGWPPGTVAVDGAIGPLTIAAANKCDPATLMDWIRKDGQAFYQEAMQADPALAPDYPNWIRRLNS